MALITINGISLDPVAESAALRAAALESPDASQSNYVLIQTTGPLADDQKAQLADLGVEIQEYVPESTYLCRYVPSDLTPIRELPFVAWANVYLEGFKIAPALRPAPPDATASVLAASVPRSPSRKPREVDVVLHPDVDARRCRRGTWPSSPRSTRSTTSRRSPRGSCSTTSPGPSSTPRSW